MKFNVYALPFKVLWYLILSLYLFKTCPGLKFKVRQLQIQEKFVQGGIPCPEAKDILSISTCNTQKPERQRSKRDMDNQDTGF